MDYFSIEHELRRARNAAKFSRLFSKPFVAALEHTDGVMCMAKNPVHFDSIITGSAAGELCVWDLTAKRLLLKFIGHTRSVRGVSLALDGMSYASCSDDCTIRVWKLPVGQQGEENSPPLVEFSGKHAFRDIDHQSSMPRFATAGAVVDLWDYSRQSPLQSFPIGKDSAVSVRFNPCELELFAASATDRSIVIHDLRTSTVVRKLIMLSRTNAIAWSPSKVFNFTTANQDGNLYTYDMRKLESALCVHQDFTSSVMDLDYSVTGREFVAGSYDRSVRIFPCSKSHSREIYHTKRMYRVFAVKFSIDGKYVFSGSDDMNVRIWKATTSRKSRALSTRETCNQPFYLPWTTNVPSLTAINRYRISVRSLSNAFYQSPFSKQ
jgi:WD repeat and SOF domain-containing protein 1